MPTIWFLVSSSTFAANEQTFGALQIGSHTYQNVRVTTKNNDYIFILHSEGMTSVKVSELSTNTLEQLGYVPKVNRSAARMWAEQAVAKADRPLTAMEAKLLPVWRGAQGFITTHLRQTSRELLVAGAGLLLMAYLFLCYCCRLICRKTGIRPGLLVWLPLLQVVPLLRAASMSPWWFIALFIPILNLWGYVLWCARIVRARNLNTLFLILLLFPVTSIFAFIYLAFSEDSPPERPVEIMTLEVA